ncbi:hypothetical protein EV421DRAFT_1810730 [Armillaria borealis]|uniref:Uncharacterized protein n=1 Tax=Armillaria borealis TaxID=47425 RepID=A0AA39MPJ4_9AGAR|nr:hypothetical protein EV421DRAFT_1810730 [Armillaria borealis]
MRRDAQIGRRPLPTTVAHRFPVAHVVTLTEWRQTARLTVLSRLRFSLRKLHQLHRATIGATRIIGSDNPHFNAGFGLMVVPFIPENRPPCTLSFSKGVGVLASQALKLGSISLQRRLLVTLKIRNKDPSYGWFLTWFTLQTKAPQNLSEESAGHEAASSVLRQGCTKKKTLETPPGI